MYAKIRSIEAGLKIRMDNEGIGSTTLREDKLKKTVRAAAKLELRDKIEETAEELRGRLDEHVHFNSILAYSNKTCTAVSQPTVLLRKQPYSCAFLQAPLMSATRYVFTPARIVLLLVFYFIHTVTTHSLTRLRKM